MLQNDYIMRMILDLAMMMRRAFNLPDRDKGDCTDDIEAAVGEAVNIDPHLFFSLEPESAVALLDMGDVDDELATYVTRAMFYEAKILESEGNITTATLRRRQAVAICKKYGVEVPPDSESAEGLVQVFLDVLDDAEAEEEKDSEKKAEEGKEGDSPIHGGNFSTVNGIPLDKLKF
ncbi:MAG: hypothetical protein ACOYIK_02765 [Coriobacteriales bacterium]|jgi:hypothetical protein